MGDVTMIYLVVGECGSYYCNGLHPLSVFGGPVDAKLAAEKARDVKLVNRDWPGGYKPLTGARVIEVPLDELALTDGSYYGCH
jgi:hypothetical protein